MPETVESVPQRKSNLKLLIPVVVLFLLAILGALFWFAREKPTTDSIEKQETPKQENLADYDKKTLDITSSDKKVKGTAGITYRGEKLSIIYNLYFTETFQSGRTRAGKIDIAGNSKDLTGLLSARYCNKDKVGDAFSVYFDDPFKCSIHGGETDSFYLAAIAESGSYQDLLKAQKLEIFESKDSFASLEKVLSSGNSIRSYELTITERSSVKGASLPPPGPPPTPPTPPTPPATPPTPPATPPTSNPTPPPTVNPPAGTKIAPDKNAPVITDIRVSNLTALEATVSWKTNEAATSLITYGPTSIYGQKLEEEGKTTEHSLVLSNLKDGTTYYFKVSSKDAAGNIGQSDEKTFTTTKQEEAETETIPLVQSKSSIPWLPIGLIGLGLVMALIFFFWKKRKKKVKS